MASYLKWLLVALVAIAFCNAVPVASARLMGGYSGEHVPTYREKEIAKSVEEEVERRWVKQCKADGLLDCSVHEFRVVSCKSQVVAGSNYIMKVKIGLQRFISIKVFVPLPYTGEPPKLVWVRQE